MVATSKAAKVSLCIASEIPMNSVCIVCPGQEEQRGERDHEKVKKKSTFLKVSHRLRSHASEGFTQLRDMDILLDCFAASA